MTTNLHSSPSVTNDTVIPISTCQTSSSTLLESNNLGNINTTSNAQANSPSAPQNLISSILAESSHPTTLLFHFAFRTTAVLVYLLFGWFVSSSFVFIVALTVVLLALDFWVVKNVTGRLLVGRRWWNSTGADGSTLWTFEARPLPWKSNPIDTRLFWTSLYGYTIAWVFLGIISFLRFNFSWLLVVVFALTLNITNLIGYLKCDRDTAAAQSSPMLSNVGSSLLGGFVNNKITSMLSY